MATSKREALTRPRSAATLTETAWLPEEDVALEQWLEHGRRLGAIGRGVAWWIGDWLAFGNARYGEKYSRATRVTGYDAQSLMNMVYVSSRFEPSRRRAALSWSHHATVAALAHDDQERWLNFAQSQRLSVHSLRLEIRAARSGLECSKGAAVAEPPCKPTAGHLVCPRCSQVIDMPA